jgi:hypothetical protein
MNKEILTNHYQIENAKIESRRSKRAKTTKIILSWFPNLLKNKPRSSSMKMSCLKASY